MSYDVNKLVNAFKEVIELTKEKENLTLEQMELRRKKAAYALNLCTVSVSQIIDYDDIAVMEHEYESILNNINLQNMPKDQALLNILNHLLDTITFFRIQEKEKTLVEKRYQNQVKNAIWEAVPSLSILTDWKDPLNVATTVGLSYMNYRRKKAEYQLNKEFEDFQLERAAIDQFNNLQRELFDTSWRLADTYNFDDKYRLTERQIKQYNKILMDNDPIRRYERLESIKDKFIAYPPYWYYLGHAALEIVNRDKRVERKLSNTKIQKYVRDAQKAFDTLLDDSLYDILREDPIVSACALEYIDTLDVNKSKDKIQVLIERAYEMAGNSYDIWQLCAMAYLRINKMEEACELLRRLVNEGYNEEMNAQLLSSIYMKLYVYSGSADILEKYNVLSLRERTYDLFSIPEERTEEAYNDCREEFIENKKYRLKERYGTILVGYMRARNIDFLKLYRNYVSLNLTNIKEIITFFNKKILANIYELPGISKEIQEKILEKISLRLDCYKDAFLFEDSENKGENVEGKLFSDIMFDSFQLVSEKISVYIDTAKDFADISELEDMLAKFCENTGMEEINDLSVKKDKETDNLLDVEVFGALSKEAEKRAEQEENAKKILQGKEGKVVKDKIGNVKLYINCEENKSYFDRYFNDEIFRHGDYRFMKQTTIAILANTKNHDDIIISVDGIRRRYHYLLLSDLVRFDKITWGKKGREEIEFEGIIWKKYVNSEVDMGELLDLFEKLQENIKDNYEYNDEMNPFSELIKY